jgi:hypothetical protein
MTATPRKGETVPGFKCITPVGKANWSTWISWKDEDGDTYSPQQAQEHLKQRQREEENYRQFLKSGLSRTERHHNFSIIAKYCELSTEHRRALQSRGLTNEQIAAGRFFSLKQWQDVPKEASRKTPGMAEFGRKLSVGKSGLACPVFDHQSNIVGIQSRLDKAPSGGRYRWLKGQYPSHLQNGELPLTVARPVNGKPLGVALCEGILKPFVAAQIHKKIFLGASGSNFVSSPEQLRIYLEAISRELGTKTIDFYPDAGSVGNAHVIREYRKTFDQLESWGYELRVAWWNQSKKLDKDCDEIRANTAIKYISLPEFEQICLQHGGYILPVVPPSRELTSEELEQREREEFLNKVVAANKPDRKLKANSDPKTQKKYVRPIKELPDAGFHIIRHSQDELLEKFDALGTKRGKEWLKLREFTPDVTIDSRYFDYDFKPGENLAINSGLNTGKSYFTNARWLANSEEGAALGGYRNCLNEQFCANGEKLNGQPWYQIQQDLKGGKDLALLADPTSRIAGAVDSWIYFAPHHFEGKKAVFDEVESVAKHLNQSSTAVSFYRDAIKSRVCDALQNSSANLIADGNLMDFTVEYFEKLSGKKFTKILNKYKGNKGKIYLYNGSSRKRQATEKDVKHGLASQIGEWISFDHKRDDYSKLHRIMMDLPIDIPILILSDSQKKCEAWDQELSALSRKVFRLDSTSSGTELGRLFLRNPRKFILEENIDTVILSPSAESGISIELLDELGREIPGYFKYEFAFFFGTSLTDTQVQFSGRNRDPYTTKFAYVQSHSLPSTRQVTTDEESSDDIFSGWFDIMRDCASLSLEGIEEGKILKMAHERIDARLRDPHIQYEAKLMLKESFEREYPRFCFEYAARNAGWEVLAVESRGDDLSDLKATQQEIAQEKAIAIFASETISTSEADALGKKLNKTPAERNQVTKSRLLGRLPGIEQKIVTQTKKVTTPEQIQEIAQSQTEKIVTVAETPYEEWKAASQPIPEKGIEVLIEKPAFNPDLINKVTNQDRAFISRLESLFFLNNPEICKVVQQHKWHKKLDLLTDPDSTSLGGLAVSRYHSKWLEVNTLYEMGIDFFLNPENSWHNESPEAIAFWQKGKLPRNARNLGVKHEENPCAYIGKVLKKFQRETSEDGQKTRPDGTRYREYSIKPMDSLSQAVYDCVEQRINSYVSELTFDWKKIIKNMGVKTSKILTEKEPQTAHLGSDILIETRGEVCVTQTHAELLATPLEQVIEALPFAKTIEEFVSIIEDVPLQTVEDAIALSGSQPRRKQLKAWLEASVRPPITINVELSWTERIKGYGQLLAEGFEHGLDVLQELLKPWTADERWGAVDQFEKIAPQKMAELVQVEPEWFKWCDM